MQPGHSDTLQVSAPQLASNKKQDTARHSVGMAVAVLEKAGVWRAQGLLSPWHVSYGHRPSVQYKFLNWYGASHCMAIAHCHTCIAVDGFAVIATPRGHISTHADLKAEPAVCCMTASDHASTASEVGCIFCSLRCSRTAARRYNKQLVC